VSVTEDTLGAVGARSRAAPRAPAREAVSSDLISVRGLAVRYGRDDPVFADVDLDVGAGDTIAIVGANGTGKSTLLKTLVGLLPASAGALSVLGERFAIRPSFLQRRALRRQVGFVFQSHALVTRASALSNVVQGGLSQNFGFRNCHQAVAPADQRRRAMDMLARVGLAEKALVRADRLSGGQAQRVAIARALTRNPKLLIADEPAASLDPAAGHEIMALFRELAAEHGITLLFTTHDMDHALTYSDRIVALKAGRLAFDEASAGMSAGRLEPIFG